MEGGRIRLSSLKPSEVKRFTAVRGMCAEPQRTDQDKKVAHHRSVQQKFETIYPVWKQLIKEPWKDRGGLERFEYGAVRARPTCILLTPGW
jgi:hypothetical protein